MSWSYAWALRSKGGEDNAGDDAVFVAHRPEADVLVLAVADGAGSADFGGVGAKVASRAFVEVAERLWSQERLASVLTGTALEGRMRAPDPDIGIAILREVQRQVRDEADRLEANPILLAATLVGVVLKRDEAFFFQIGDGAAVIRIGDDYETAVVPEETEFVNTTYFITSPDAEAHVQTRVVEARIEEVALFSDGIQMLVLHPTDQSPHAAFFGTVFRTLREPGEDAASKAWLGNMLGSDMVTSRTDDDTSIVIARRLE
ncbi:MAG: PP2C family serine/threonine-protein phosphatase [Fimbriimonas sp.]